MWTGPGWIGLDWTWTGLDWIGLMRGVRDARCKQDAGGQCGKRSGWDEGSRGARLMLMGDLVE